MPDLLIRNITQEMQRQLKARAESNHRSMMKEVHFILEESLIGKSARREMPEPYEGSFGLTDDWIAAAKRSDRV
ncbi:MAG: Arc family DNA-binding protein [Candidatus Marinimicrobia bacterium]|jgi:plasmid stability protein|nr:Arc family DNA-binding protein [Candidatus Neomarinimicrobiota bacterium]MBT4068849.1 Arc family DNA-binding protein [Candidatus Neomarinimicrobiota bacterium]MBT4810161.1 Arc family DNA-binding protein [Candidatus Neomarinimicrobiota bacterium]MBT5177149.1 Arc family DNA-binding protein [Candidatus Neomarinimicrobiota bacterium]MBT6638486.1 Arc family DNA-binding protein [Candidatus Neomarinimicrobiota bacterium]